MAIRISTVQAASAAFVAFLVLYGDIIGMIQYALAVRKKFGFFKAILFAIVMRFGWMSAFPGTSLDGFVSFKGGYEFVPSIETKHSVGILFFPGATVDPIAYAPLLRQISTETNSAVTLVCAKYPFRNPVVFSKQKGLELMKRHQSVKTWIIAGHSMGAGSYGAAGFVWWLKKQQNDIDISVDGLVMMAGTITGDEVDLSKEKNLYVLAILASEDTIVPPEGNSETGQPVRKGIDEKCPKRNTQTLIIKGGNHAGFGDYGPQRFPYPDGERTISLREQQDITVKHVASLTNKISKRSNKTWKLF